jgi:DNA invertase Pin-like site-specific DNA recombinase
MTTEPSLHHPADTLRVFYGRVSTGGQDLARQRAAAERVAADLDLYDDGVSAFKLPIEKRPEGAKLVEMIRAGQVAELHVDAQDRLSRGSLVEWVTFLALCEAHDVAVFAPERITEDLGGEAIGALRALLAHDESRTKSRRVRGGKRAAAASGFWPHGKVPLGYLPAPAPDHPDRTVLVPDPQTAPVVAEAFRRFAHERASHREILAYLEEATGQRFDRTFPRVFFRNAVYRGLVRNGDETFDGRHPALVDEMTFADAQRRLLRRRGEKRQPPRTHLLTKIARCSCGNTLRFRTTPKGHRYAMCGQDCGARTIPANALELSVAKYLAVFIGEANKRLCDPVWAVDDPDDVEEAQRAYDEASERLDRAAGLVLDGALTREHHRFQEALAAREEAQTRLLRATQGGRGLRAEVESLVEALLAFLSPEDQNVAHFVGDFPPELVADLIVVRWNAADFAERRALLERTLDGVEATREGLSLAIRPGISVPSGSAQT